MHKVDDAMIIEMLNSSLENRNKALSILYDQLYPGIARFIMKNSGTKLDSKDLFQESLIVFYEKAITPEFQLTGSIKNYLHAVCRNIWFKKLRHAGKEISFEHSDLQLLGQVDEIPEAENERQVLFAKLMNQLGEGCKNILHRFYFDRQSMKEIAEELNLANEGVAKNKKARCMKKLKQLAKLLDQ
ncbi:MAG: sigma-70 family RNA polymerase sigma factor [Bacteroidota bacterium]